MCQDNICLSIPPTEQKGIRVCKFSITQLIERYKEIMIILGAFFQSPIVMSVMRHRSSVEFGEARSKECFDLRRYSCNQSNSTFFFFVLGGLIFVIASKQWRIKNSPCWSIVQFVTVNVLKMGSQQISTSFSQWQWFIYHSAPSWRFWDEVKSGLLTIKMEPQSDPPVKQMTSRILILFISSSSWGNWNQLY